MKKRILAALLAVCMLLTCAPSIFAADPEPTLSYIAGTKSSDPADSTTEPLKLPTNGSAELQLFYNGVKLTNQQIKKSVDFPDGLKVIFETETQNGDPLEYIILRFEDINDTSSKEIEYEDATLKVEPVMPTYGFYTSAAPSIGTLVEDLELTETTTTLYFCQYDSNITFQYDSDDLTVAQGTPDANGVIELTLTVTDAFKAANTTTSLTAIRNGKKVAVIEELSYQEPQTGFSYRLMEKDGSDYVPVTGHLTKPLTLEYGSMKYIAFYYDGVKLRDDDYLECTGVILKSMDDECFKVIASDPEVTSASIRYESDPAAAPIRISITQPEYGFYSDPRCELRFFLQDLELLQNDTTIYFCRGDADTEFEYNQKYLTVTPGAITKGVIPLTLSVTNAELLASKGATLIALQNDEEVASVGIELADKFGDLPDYALCTLDDGQYRMIDTVLFRHGGAYDQTATLYLRSITGTPLTSDDLSRIGMSWQTGLEQNNQITYTAAWEEGMIAITITRATEDEFNGVFKVSLGNDVVDQVNIKHVRTVAKEGFAGFKLDNKDYTIGFAMEFPNGVPAFVQGSVVSESPLSEDTAEQNLFSIALASGSGDNRTAEPKRYNELVKSVTFTVEKAGSSGEMPERQELKWDNVWDTLALRYYRKNAGAWRITAEIELAQPVLTEEDGVDVQVDRLRLSLVHTRREEQVATVDLTMEYDSFGTAQRYLDMVADEDRLDDLMDELNTDKLVNRNCILELQMPGGEYVRNLNVGDLQRRVRIVGYPDPEMPTVIIGTICTSGDGSDGLIVENIRFLGDEKAKDTRDDNATPNCAVTGGGTVTFNNCVFENFYIAIDDRFDGLGKNDEKNMRFGGEGNTFRNNTCAYYLRGADAQGSSTDPVIRRAVFENNDCAVYIESLYRRYRAYEYGVEQSKFIDNGVDIYYAGTKTFFAPCNFFGKTENGKVVSRSPVIQGAGSTQTYALTDAADTAALVIVDPVYSSEEMVKLTVGADTTAFQMKNDNASDQQIDAASLTGRTEALSIEVVEAAEAAEGTESEDCVTVGIWNIAAKKTE